MDSLFKNRFLISFLKVIACVLLIALSHSAFLWQNTLPAEYDIIYSLWLYVGVPCCLIAILTEGKPAPLWMGFWPFMVKLVGTVAGIFILQVVCMDTLMGDKIYGGQPEERPILWIWNSYYYILLLLIWQPRIFEKEFKGIKYPIILFFILFALFAVMSLVLMYSDIKSDKPATSALKTVPETNVNAVAGENEFF